MIPLNRLFRIKRTQIEMMRDRKFDISDEEWMLEDKVNTEKFREHYGLRSDRTNDKNIVTKSPLSHDYSDIGIYTRKARVEFYDEERDSKLSSTTAIQGWIDDIHKKGYTQYIVITSQTPSPQASNEMSKQRSINITIFLYDEFNFNKTKHFLYSPHELILKEMISETDNLVKSRVPMISIDDPIIKYFGGKIGDMVLIQRRNFIYGTPIKETKILRLIKQLNKSDISEEDIENEP